MPNFEKILSKNVKITEGCWLWIASKSKNGYGKIVFEKKHTSAHRVIYQHFKGLIPKGMVIDHLCRNKICVNPSHLEAVTQKENILRGFSPASLNSKKTICKNGHFLSGKNLYVTPNGRRNCVICRQNSSKKHILKKGGSLA